MRYQAALRPDRVDCRAKAAASESGASSRGAVAWQGGALGKAHPLGKAGRGVIGGAHFQRASLAPRHWTNGTMIITSLLAAAAPSGGIPQWVGILPYIAIFVIFWLLLIRPQQRRAREHQAQVMAVKKGDRVVTGGGLIGKVTRVGEHEVEVELAQGMRVQAVKSTLSQVGDTAVAKPAND